MIHVRVGAVRNTKSAVSDVSWYYNDRSSDFADVEREIKKRRKKGEAFVAVEAATARGAPAASFWGVAWCKNIEAYRDYESRLPRGRSYLRKGSVYDLEICEGYIFAYVAGSGLYEVEITIDPLSAAKWKTLKKKLGGEVGNMVDLLSGKLGPGVMEAVTDLKGGLFPDPKQIHVNCNCPDFATLCKHAASVLYGVGCIFDEHPEKLFTLRAVDPDELIEAAGGAIAKLGDSQKASPLAADELSELFGIDLAEPEAAF